MKKKNRLIILSICAATFLIIVPYAVLYSLGYRVDFENQKILATGGIYVKALPEPVDVIIDQTIKNTTGYFYNSVFVQNLTPTIHTVDIKKEGYFDYQKSLLVREKEVTKLENVILFKKKTAFSTQVESASKGETLPDAALFALLTKKPVQIALPASILKSIITHTWQDALLLYLGTDGFLYAFDVAAKTSQILSQSQVVIDKKKTYTLQEISGKIFLQAGTVILLFNEKTNEFEDFYQDAHNVIVSPDGQKVLYYNASQVLYYFLNPINTASPPQEKNILLYTSQKPITNAYWLNNDYVLFLAGDSVVISEIDVRGNINSITLQSEVLFKNPEIFFNPQDKKLYVLSQETLLVSERLVP